MVEVILGYFVVMNLDVNIYKHRVKEGAKQRRRTTRLKRGRKEKRDKGRRRWVHVTQIL